MSSISKQVFERSVGNTAPQISVLTKGSSCPLRCVMIHFSPQKTAVKIEVFDKNLNSEKDNNRERSLRAVYDVITGNSNAFENSFPRNFRDSLFI